MANKLYTIRLSDEQSDRLEKVARACDYTDLSDCVIDLFFYALKEHEMRVHADAYRQLQFEVAELFDPPVNWHRKDQRPGPDDIYDDDIPF